MNILSKTIFTLLLAFAICTAMTIAYSAQEDIRVINDYRRQLNHALITRQLVHQTNWSAVSTISTDSRMLSYPIANTIAIDDSTLAGKSNGRIHFLLTDLDFTGQDWQANNKVSFLFTDEQTLNCAKKGIDPMEPTCPRAILSGEVLKLNVNGTGYNDALNAFVNRHTASTKWMQTHHFYLCELVIQNIYILDGYGGPHNVAVDDYYNVEL